MMTLRDMYDRINGDYDSMFSRLHSDEKIKKFLVKFADSNMDAAVRNALDAGDYETAFREAHTLKGVCANLCFDRLLASAGQLTELLRPETGTIPGDAALLLETVAQDYEETVSAIRAYLDDDAS